MAWAHTTAVALAILLAPLPSVAQEKEKETEKEEPAKPQALAVVVNLKNPTTNLSVSDLRAYFKHDRTFWPGGERVQLYLRTSGSPEMQILLDEVYEMSASRLRRYLRGKNFRGEVTGGKAYTIAPSTAKAVARVSATEGAISVVLADEVPKEGVRVLSIDGKRPGDEGYPLVAAAKPKSDGASR